MLSMHGRRVWTRWQAGPAAGTATPVLVSLTEYTLHSARWMPGFVARGLRLGLGWYAVPGAVGLSLWLDPVYRRGGSVSVWTGKSALQDWVALPLHVRTMRQYRDRGRLRSTTWFADPRDTEAIRAEAARRLDTGEFG